MKKKDPTKKEFPKTDFNDMKTLIPDPAIDRGQFNLKHVRENMKKLQDKANRKGSK